MTTIQGSPFFCSWSGGKDSCLSLYRAIQSGGAPKALLTMMTEGGDRSRSHGLSIDVLRRQAQTLDIPLVVRNSTWNDYENTFISALGAFRADGIEHGAFGDIDMDPNLEWVERVCSSAGIRAYEPLWKTPRRELLGEFLQLGFEATIVAVKQSVLSDSFLGRVLDERVIADMEEAGIDASGEVGEYHTVVTAGPLFSSPIHLEQKAQVARDGYCFLDVSIGTDT